MRISVYYHCILGGGSRPIDYDFALGIIVEQMEAIKMSGLGNAADCITIGYSGSYDDSFAVQALAPNKAVLCQHPQDQQSEIPTLNLLRNDLPALGECAVLYHHQKGVSYPDQPFYAQWRRCMERACVWNWRECVEQLSSGAIDSAGAHWLTPERHGEKVKTPFWGGTFWWATAAFLRTLPLLPAPTWANRYEAEAWIGKGPVRPRVWDQAPHWPSPQGCM